MHKKTIYSSHFEIFIRIYSVRNKIDQITTNTSRYTTCCAANEYIFVYILIGRPIVPLNHIYITIAMCLRINFGSVCYSFLFTYLHLSSRILLEFIVYVLVICSDIFAHTIWLSVLVSLPDQHRKREWQ